MTNELDWRKSSRSGGGPNECVEVALCADRAHVRDSKDPRGGMLTVGSAVWAGFLDAVKGGSLTDPHR